MCSLLEAIIGLLKLFKLSGGIFSMRKVLSMTLAKTGAATAPPKCPKSLLGSSIVTTVTNLGLLAGTIPTNNER